MEEDELIAYVYLGYELLLYVIQVVTRFLFFKKAGVPRWKAFIPFYNTIVNYKVMGMNGWWVLSQVPSVVIAIPGLKIPVWLLGLSYIVKYGVDFIFAYNFKKAFNKKWWMIPIALIFQNITQIIAALSSKFKYDEKFNRYKWRKVGDKIVPAEKVKEEKEKLVKLQREEEKRLALEEPEPPEKTGFLKKITDFIVVHHKLVLIVMLALTAGCGVLAMKVNVNRDLTKYMPESSETAKGLDIMYREYEEVLAMPLSVMVKDLSAEEKQSEKKYLEEMDGVASINYDESEEYNKNEYTLYELTVSGKADGEKAVNVYKEITKHFGEKGKEIKMRGEVATTNATTLPLWVIAMAVVSALAILIIMAESYVEPVLYLLAIGLAVAMNMGTNAFLPSVSQITNSITAVLQLALSMDYSIMLATEFHREKAKGKDKITAMKAALSRSFTAISASSVTTIVGMLVLLLMSFTIGRDLGIVLAKGVLLCLVSIFTALPAFLIIFDGLIEKTRKKAFSPNLTVLGNISYKIRKFAIPIFLLIFGGSFALQMQVGNLYTNTDSEAIDAIFGPYNQMVVMYDHAKDEDKIAEFCKKAEVREDTKKVLCYGNTINEPVKANELLDKFASLGNKVELSEDLIKFLYYHSYDKDETHQVSIAELVNFLKTNAASDAILGNFINDETSKQLDRLALFTDTSELYKWRSVNELASIMETDRASVNDLMVLFDAKRGKTGDGMTPRELVDFIKNKVLQNPRYKSEVSATAVDVVNLADKILSIFEELEVELDLKITADELYELISLAAEAFEKTPSVSKETINTLYALHWHEVGGGTKGMSLWNLLYFMNNHVLKGSQAKRISNDQKVKIAAISEIVRARDEKRSGAGLYELISPLSNKISAEKLELVNIYHGAKTALPEDYKMTVEGVVEFLSQNILNDERFSSVLGDKKEKIVAARDKIADAKKQLIHGDTGRAVIRAALPAEGEETFKLVKELKEDLDSRELESPVYFVGNSSMAYEMSQSFTRESYIITIVTALVIYIVVAISFKSWSIPLILVMLIQTAVWITMTITGFTDGSIYFLALIIVQSLLMGATIDYAIMYTEQYVAARERGLKVSESVPLAYNKSIQAILTSAGVLTIVTAIVGNFAGNTAGKICKAISDGTFFSTILILLMLPALLAACDKIVIRKAKKKK